MSDGVDLGELARQPWFSARREGADVVIEGAPDALIGRRVELAEAERPTGNWTEWHWDGQELVVSNDLFGCSPVFYAATESSIRISPAVDRLLALGVPSDLDYDALAAFLGLGYYLDQDTPFRAIRVLPPAVTLRWAPGRLELESARPRFATEPMTRDEAIDRIIELVRAAVARCIPSRASEYLMPLSGGRDSRHLLLELRRAGHVPRATLTTEHHASDWGGDVPFAARLAAALEVPHRVLRPGPLVEAEWRKNRLTGYTADEHAWYLPVADALNGRVEHTYDGLAGSTALQPLKFFGKAIELGEQRRWDELAAHLCKTNREGTSRFADLVAPRFADRLNVERAAARVRTCLRQYEEQPDPVLTFRFWNRSMRELPLMPMRMLHDVPSVYTPLMHSDFFLFAKSIPREHLDKDFHSDAIARAFPEVADIPYSSSKRPRPDRRFNRSVARQVLSLIRRGDASLVDRGALERRAIRSFIRGDDTFTWGRRASLITHLVQLGSVVDGRGTAWPG